MIVSRAPLRMSIVGGGSDLPSFYSNHRGAVISTAINKYIYVTVNKKFDNGIRIGYSKNEDVNSVNEIEHNIVRESLKLLGISGGIEITTIADIPSKGTGLGSSSTFTVALLQALNAYNGVHISADHLAKAACEIEIKRCGEPIGKQDQYISSFGGFNLIEFFPDDEVKVSPIVCKRDTLKKLESNILLFYTGLTRSASKVLAKQSNIIAKDNKKRQIISKMVELTDQLAKDMQNNNIESFGEILHEGWIYKKSLLSEISNSVIDTWYEVARKNGATGGKILGAGAGGFLMLYAPKYRHSSIVSALSDLRYMPFSFEQNGSRILYYNM